VGLVQSGRTGQPEGCHLEASANRQPALQ
jgi:hypothetical protein